MRIEFWTFYNGEVEPRNFIVWKISLLREIKFNENSWKFNDAFWGVVQKGVEFWKFLNAFLMFQLEEVFFH